jgi:hypothetical protein
VQGRRLAAAPTHSSGRSVRRVGLGDVDHYENEEHEGCPTPHDDVPDAREPAMSNEHPRDGDGNASRVGPKGLEPERGAARATGAFEPQTNEIGEGGLEDTLSHVLRQQASERSPSLHVAGTTHRPAPPPARSPGSR